MAAEDIHVRLCLQEIVKLDLEAKALIQDIRDVAKTSEMLEELNQDVREKIHKLQNKINDLDELGREQDKDTDREAILKNVETHKQKLLSTRTCLRQTNIKTQLMIDKQNKQELLNGGSELRQRTKGNKETLAAKAGNITESLMNLNRMMVGQVKQSEQTNTTLISSSKTVSDTHDEFQTMGGHIQTSHRLLTKYDRRDLTDKLLIFLALVFFFATVLYIVKKRVWPS